MNETGEIAWSGEVAASGMPRRPSANIVLVGAKPSRRLDAFFEELCVKYGWCLNHDDRARVEGFGVDDRTGFVDSVIEVYTGLDADLCERHERKWVSDLAEKWMFDPKGPGAESGLD